MSNISTMTTKGQVVIPKPIRKIYQLEAQSKLLFEPAGEMIIIKPIGIKITKTLGDKLAAFGIGKNIRKEWEKTLQKKLAKWGW